MSRMTLYTNPQSRGLAVETLLAELQVDCECVNLEFGTSMKAPKYLAINPFGKVPTLMDGEIIIHELPAICAYLADKYADKGLAPALDDPRRGLYFRWLFFGAGPLECANTDLALGVEIDKEQQVFVGYGTYDTMYKTLVRELEEADPYLCGGQFTAADVFTGGYILFLMRMDKIKPHPAMVRYAKALLRRPSMARQAELALQTING